MPGCCARSRFGAAAEDMNRVGLIHLLAAAGTDIAESSRKEGTKLGVDHSTTAELFEEIAVV